MALLLVIIIAAAVAIQSPAVQTAVGKAVVQRFQNKIDGEIEFGSISVTPFNAILLEDFVIKDSHSRVEGMDTLLYVKNLSAKFSLAGIFKGDMAHVSRLRLDGGLFHLVMEPGDNPGDKAVINLMRVFRIEKDPDEPKKDPYWGNIVSARRVDIENLSYRMDNLALDEKQEARGKVPDPNAINWNHLRATLVKGEMENLKVAETKVLGEKIKVHVYEEVTGWDLKEVTVGSMRIGDGAVKLGEVKIYDGFSSLDLEHFHMEGALASYSDFVNKVVFDGTIRDGSLLDMRGTLGHIASTLKERGVRLKLSGHVRGPVNAIGSEEGLRAEDPDSGVSFFTTGIFRDAVKIRESSMHFDVKNLSFDMPGLDAFLASWAPGMKPAVGKFAPGERFTFNGTVDGPLEDLGIKGDIFSQDGDILAQVGVKDILDKSKPITIAGNIGTKSLDLGHVLGIKDLGEASLDAKLGVSIAGKQTGIFIDSLRVASLEAMGYTYTGLECSGSMVGKNIKAKLTSADPNLRLRFDGDIDLDQERSGADAHFTLDIPHADLHAIGLDKREISKIALSAKGDIVRHTPSSASGEVSATDITLESDQGRSNIGNLIAQAVQDGNNHSIDIKSSFADISFKGDRPSTEFAKDITQAIFSEEDNTCGNYTLGFNIKDAQKLLSFLHQGIYAENGTGGTITVTEDGRMNASVSSGRLALLDKYIKGLSLSASSSHADGVSLSVSGKTIAVGGTSLTDSNLKLNAKLTREAGGPRILGKVLPSATHLGDRTWGLSSGDIAFHNGDIEVDRFTVGSGEMELDVSGGYSKTKTDTLRIGMKQFDLAMVNTIIGETPQITGNATGNVMLVSPSQEAPGLIAGINCENIHVSGRSLGDIVVRSNWDEGNKRFVASLKNNLEGRTSIDVNGWLSPSTKDVNATMNLDALDLGYAAPFLETLFSTFEGALGGSLSVSGKLGDLKLSSKDLSISNGTIALEFTGVPYKAEGGLSLDNEGLHFTSLSLSDGEGGTGSVGGLIDLRDFKNIGMNLEIPFRNMHAIDVRHQDGIPFFGSVYGSGKVSLSGPLKHLLLRIEARTRSGDLHIPLGSISGKSSKNLLTFKEAPLPFDADPYEMFIGTKKEKEKGKSDLELRLRVTARPGTNIHLDIDEESSLQCTGNGVVDIYNRARQGVFTLGGDYTISSGMFHFSAMSLVTRDFTILDGSSIRFNGDLWDTDLNVNGRYTTKASLAPITTQEASSTRRNVYCGLGITGKLRNPQLEFSVEVPDLNPAIQAEVDAALSTEDRIQRQFIYLLVASSFLPSEESGVSTGGSDVLYSNVSSIMAGQLNNIFEKLDIPVDLGLGFKSTQAGDNLFDVAVSTQLFNNRVVVNGTVGNREQLGGTAASEVAGDIDIEIKLNRSGSLRLNLFTHSADQLSSYLDNSQRHGGGIAYQMEFNTFAQLWRELFTPRRAREEAAMRLPGNVVYQVDSTGKVHRHE